MSKRISAPSLALPFALSLSLSLSLSACDEHHHDEDPVAEACEHLGGAPTPLTAAATATGAPEVKADHKRYDVTLGDVSGGKAGVVSFTSTQKGHLLVFLSVDVPVLAKASTGLDVTLNASSKTATCPTVKAWYEYEVGVGRYDFTLGGAGNTTSTVGMVLETQTHEH
jgi:hypothetical protein